jgi:hypothetical protein
VEIFTVDEQRIEGHEVPPLRPDQPLGLSNSRGQSLTTNR